MGAVTVDLERVVLLDIETGGFAGTPVFLIGLLSLRGGPAVIEQLLARDYPEERAIMERLAEVLRGDAAVVSFNGKTFDLPFLQDRAARHHVRLATPALHVDLLHAARRRWRGVLPDCRLETLEAEVLGRRRVGDIPGSDVPDLFHHFYRTGNAAPLRGVLEHNRRDLLASAELLLELGEAGGG